MQKILFLLFIICVTTIGNAQVIIDTTASQNKAVLEIKFSENASDQKRGVILPRMSTTERDAIQDPKNGLVIYNTDEKAINIYINPTVGWRKLQGTKSNT